MRNIEIKTPLLDRADVERRLTEAGARLAGVLRQRDTFYEVPHGWLKLREHDGGDAELISYVRATDATAARPSDYDVIRLDDAARWKSLLGRVLHAHGIVAKERTLWLHAHTRIHLDRVESLGDFLELETVIADISEPEARAEADRMIDTLALDRTAFLSVPYRELLPDR